MSGEVPSLTRAACWLAGAPVRAATWRWAWFSSAGLLAGVVALAAGFVGLLAEALLLLTVVGIPLMLLLLRGLRGFAQWERCRLRWAGIAVASPYTQGPVGRSWLARLADPLRDPATLRDLAWLLLAGPVGIGVALVTGVSWLTAVASATLPVWYRWLPGQRAVLESTPHRHLFVIDSVPSAMPYALAGLALIWVSAWLTAGFGYGQAQLMRTLLLRAAHGNASAVRSPGVRRPSIHSSTWSTGWYATCTMALKPVYWPCCSTSTWLCKRVTIASGST